MISRDDDRKEFMKILMVHTFGYTRALLKIWDDIINARNLYGTFSTFFLKKKPIYEAVFR